MAVQTQDDIVIGHLPPCGIFPVRRTVTCKILQRCFSRCLPLQRDITCHCRPLTAPHSSNNPSRSIAGSASLEAMPTLAYLPPLGGHSHYNGIARYFGRYQMSAELFRSPVCAYSLANPVFSICQNSQSSQRHCKRAPKFQNTYHVRPRLPHDFGCHSAHSRCGECSLLRTRCYSRRAKGDGGLGYQHVMMSWPPCTKDAVGFGDT